MALAKTVGVLVLIGLMLWVIFTVIGILAATIATFLEFFILAAIVGAIYHHFKRQEAH